MGFLIPLLGSIVGVALFLGYYPSLLDVRPQPFSDSPPVKFEGPLAPNNKLDAIEKLYKDKVAGPESIASYEGAIYAPTAEATIVRLKDNEVKIVARTGEPCATYKEGKKCSRPYGLRFDKTGQLYVADGDKGLLRVDVKTGKVEVLVQVGDLVDGVAVLFPDDVDVDDDGNVYFSDVSTRWKHYQFMFGIFEHENSGRILKYESKTKKTSVVAKDMYFANGVQLTHNKDSILVSETTARRVTRVYIKGSKKGTRETFVNLPGEPDNIRPSLRGGYWVALAFGGSPQHLGGHMQTYVSHPTIRTIILRWIFYTGSAFEYLNDLWPHPILEETAHLFKSGKILMNFAGAAPGMVVEIDENGKILRSLQASTKSISFFSEVLEENGQVYLASYENPYLGKLKL